MLYNEKHKHANHMVNLDFYQRKYHKKTVELKPCKNTIINIPIQNIRYI